MYDIRRLKSYSYRFIQYLEKIKYRKDQKCVNSFTSNASLGQGGYESVDFCFLTKTHNSLYYKRSRYNIFINAINRIISHNDIHTVLDLATSSGHFVFLANMKGIDCSGCDIDIAPNHNDLFLKIFQKKCIFKHDISYIENIHGKYDIITNFHLTHIFNNEAFHYLLSILSNKSKYAYLHSNTDNIHHIKKYDFIKILKIDSFDINMNGVDYEYFVFLEFTREVKIDEYFRLCRPHGQFNISICK